MTRNWRHEVSTEWLKARRDVLTASEIKTMLPEYKRMLKKPAGTFSPGFFGLCGAKLSHDVPDPESVGAAARGHIMEPYAVEDWNNNNDTKYYHWDDIVIKRNGIGYSPDALTIRQEPGMGVELWYSDVHNKLVQPVTGDYYDEPTSALEVKCYEPKNHMKGYITKKEDREERLQLAVAFMVLPNLQFVDIMWYCPDAPIPIYTEQYTREDLKTEIGVITGMLKMFHFHMNEIRNINANEFMVSWTEDEIYNEYLKINSEYFIKI